jgi:hypothetical protein
MLLEIVIKSVVAFSCFLNAHCRFFNTLMLLHVLLNLHSHSGVDKLELFHILIVRSVTIKFIPIYLGIIHIKILFFQLFQIDCSSQIVQNLKAIRHLVGKLQIFSHRFNKPVRFTQIYHNCKRLWNIFSSTL